MYNWAWVRSFSQTHICIHTYIYCMCMVREIKASWHVQLLGFLTVKCSLSQRSMRQHLEYPLTTLVP